MLRYLSAGRQDYREDPVGISRRVNWEFLAVVQGAAGPLLVGEPTRLAGRRLWVFPPSTPHGWMSERPLVRACFHFGFAPLPLETWALARGYHTAPLSSAAARRVLDLARGLQPHYDRPTGVSLLHFHRALIELSLLALANVPVAELPKPENLAEQKVDAAIAWYAEHLPDRPGLAEVARAVHVSPSHLRRLFLRTRRTAPHAALREIQMRRAMELMTHSTDKLSVIAERCGFGSPADFSRAFRARYRIRPSAWRRGSLLPDDARNTPEPR